MWGLIKNELLKLRRKNMFCIVIVFMLLVTVIQCYAEYTKITRKAPEKIIAECQKLIEGMENMTVIQSGGGSDSASSDVNKWIEDTIEDAKREIERAQKKIENMGRDWKINAREEIALLETMKEEAKAERNLEKQENIDTRINILTYHLDHDIKPDEEYIMKSTVILDIITYLSSIFIAVVVMMLTVETIAGENSPGTIKLLLTKPVSRGKIFISKFLASFIASAAIIIFIEAVTFLAVGIISGFGNMQAPAAIGPLYEPDPVRIARYGMGVTVVPGSTVLVPLWQKLFIVLSLQGLFILTITSFAMFISSIMKNGVLALILGLFITAVLTVMTVQIKDFGSIKAIAVIMPYLFSTYSSGGMILNGYLSSSLSSTLVSIPFAMLIMTVWAALFFAAGYRFFAKKDILMLV